VVESPFIILSSIIPIKLLELRDMVHLRTSSRCFVDILCCIFIHFTVMNHGARIDNKTLKWNDMNSCESEMLPTDSKTPQLYYCRICGVESMIELAMTLDAVAAGPCAL
jgi:hypothetical protein